MTTKKATITLHERHADILRQLDISGRLDVVDLAARYRTTAQTIRKDLHALEQVGRLVRIHGGAVRVPRASYMDYAHRLLVAPAQKAAIGQACARLIPNGSTVFINVGTTTEAAAHALRNHRSLRIITDNVRVANVLRSFPGIEVLIAGGRVRATDGAIVGDQAVSFIRQFRVDFALVGAAAIEEDGALLDHDLHEAQVATAITETARHVILAADHGKFGRKAPICIGQLSGVHSFVTDAPPPPAIRTVCDRAQVAVHIVGDTARQRS